jgi:zinc protease
MKLLTKTALCASAIALSTFATPLLAQDKETPPAPTEARPFTLPAPTVYALPNGLQVTLVPYGKTPQVTILASVRTGNIDEGDDVWLADFAGGLMEKGAGGRNASQLADLAASMGGSLDLGVGTDTVTASTGVLGEYAPQAIGLMADLLIHPDFPESEVAKVRADLLRNLSVSRSQPGPIANEAYAKDLYPDHPYGRLYPEQAQVEGYTLAQAKAFYDANFGAQRTHIYVVGRFDDAAVRKAIADSFGSWKTGEPATSLPSLVVDPADVVLIDRPGAPQSTLRIGQRVESAPGDVAFAAMNTLLGGYFSSRITRNIREDKGYTYSPGSGITQRPFGANWTQFADVTAEATGPSITEILKEVRRMQTELPSDKEVQGIKNYMNGVFVIGLASRGGVAGQLAGLDALGLGPEYLNTYVSRVSALTAEDFRAEAVKNLPLEQMTYVVVGPMDSVRAQLEAVPELAGRLPE